jgi:hypothetical protein
MKPDKQPLFISVILLYSYLSFLGPGPDWVVVYIPAFSVYLINRYYRSRGFPCCTLFKKHEKTSRQERLPKYLDGYMTMM